MTMQELAREMTQLVTETGLVFRGQQDDYWTADQGAGKWTRLEILGHLVDSALNNHQRIVRAIADGGVVWPGYDQDAMVRVQQFATERPELVIGLWEHLNLHLARLIETISEDRQDAVCVIGGGEPVSLAFLADDYLRHMRHHLRQILGPPAV